MDSRVRGNDRKGSGNDPSEIKFHGASRDRRDACPTDGMGSSSGSRYIHFRNII